MSAMRGVGGVRRRIAQPGWWPALGLGAVLALGPGPAAAQQVRVAMLPDTATVGDVVRAAIWLELPAGWRAAVADTLPVSGTMENAGPRQQLQRARPDGGVDLALVFPLTPWRPGPQSVPAFQVHLVGGGIDSVVTVRFPRLQVVSVLPADTTGIRPKPPRDVVGANRLLWPYILAALLALLILLALAYWLWRRSRRRPAAAVVGEVLAPRARALRELDRVRAAGMLDSGEIKLFYARSTEAVRHYLAALDAAWGEDRTTSELIPRLRAVDLEAAAALARLLDGADLVKFARQRRSTGEALEDWAGLRRWVEEFREPAVEAEPAQAVAA